LVSDIRVWMCEHWGGGYHVFEGLECCFLFGRPRPWTVILCEVMGVIKPTLLSFFSPFFLPIRYNMPFLCPHMTCQTVTCQALSGSFQPQSVRLFQPHSNPQQATQLSGSVSLTLDHSPSFLSHPPCHSLSRSMSLSLAISLSHSVAYATLSQDGALCLLSLLSLSVPHLLIPTPRRTLAFFHSLCLCIALTHVVLFSHVVALSF